MTGAFFLTRSQTSPSKQAPAAMALAASMTLPPPNATMTSIFSSRQIATPRRTESILGFGAMPDNSDRRQRGSCALTLSRRPMRRTLPPPVTRRTLEPNCSTAAVRPLMTPSPKTRRVGRFNSKGSMESSAEKSMAGRILKATGSGVGTKKARTPEPLERTRTSYLPARRR